jgi:hypothetical protein
MQLQYQLSGTLDSSAEAELFVVDLFETTRAQIDALHARGRVLIAFISAGSLEPWRPDIDVLPAAAIGNSLPGYPDEAWLDVREPKKEVVAAHLVNLCWNGLTRLEADPALGNEHLGS